MDEPQDPLEYIRGAMGLTAEEEEPAEEPEVEEPAPDDEDLTRAREFVERRFGKSLLDGMSAAQIKAISVDLAATDKRHSDLANELDRVKKAQHADRPDSAETEQDGDPVRPSESPDGLDISEAMLSLDRDLVGEELPDALAKLATIVDRHGDTRMKAALEALSAENRAMNLELVDNLVRRDLEERFPSVRDSETSKALREKMALLDPGLPQVEGEDIASRRARLMEHAMVLIDPTAVAESRSKSNPRKAGVSPPQQRGKIQPIPMSDDERLVAYQQFRQDGKSVDESKQLAGLPVG